MYKVQQLFHNKVQQVFLKSVTGTTKWDENITKCEQDLNFCFYKRNKFLNHLYFFKYGSDLQKAVTFLFLVHQLAAECRPGSLLPLG